MVGRDGELRVIDVESRRTVQSVERAATVLRVLARQEGGTTGELARHLGVHKSTVSRLVRALEEAELVERDPASGRLHLGLAILTMAGSVLSRLEVLRIADPALRRLAESTQETVNLVIRSGNEIINVEQIPGADILRSFDWIGKTVTLHRGAAGKAVLAYLAPHERDAYLHDLHAADGSVDIDRLRRDIDDTRRRGFAVNRGEMNPNVYAVGAPIFDASGRCGASISVAGYREAFDERLAVLARQAVDTAATISRQLGYSIGRFPVMG